MTYFDASVLAIVAGGKQRPMAHVKDLANNLCEEMGWDKDKDVNEATKPKAKPVAKKRSAK